MVATRTGDSVAYRAAYERISELHERNRLAIRRRELLNLLALSAEAWAREISTRQGVHGQDRAPGNPTAAWRWRQLEQELTRRSALDPLALGQQLRKLHDEEQQLTANLVEARAWAWQAKRTGLRERSALVGWAHIIRDIRGGTGKRVPRLLAEARTLMNQCRPAVPVWIMPVSRVAERFTPGQDHFDVVVIDEASQSDVMGLLALYMGARVVVVGDDKQVSPEAVGQDLDQVQHLIDEFLEGVRNKHLYDGRRSIYDVAHEAFGGVTMLQEHFRCIPQIIQFSNDLCYEGRIQPLRDESGVRTLPFLVPYRVPGTAHEKVNEEEAITVASLLMAAVEQPEYADKTFGVISTPPASGGPGAATSVLTSANPSNNRGIRRLMEDFIGVDGDRSTCIERGSRKRPNGRAIACRPELTGQNPRSLPLRARRTLTSLTTVEN